VNVVVNTSKITIFINSVLASLNELVPITTDKPQLIKAHVSQKEYSVLIGLLGEIKGRLFLIGDRDFFQQIALTMWGMELSSEMLESFIGEMGNLLGGHTATALSTNNITIDITPPTTLKGNVSFGGFTFAFFVTCHIGEQEGVLVMAVEEPN
jgi:chemotaxis protein CheX